MGVDDPRDWAGREPHLLVVDANGGDPTVIAPDFDRPSREARPALWLTNNEVAFVALNQGSIVVARARIGQRGASIVAGGDTQIESFDLHGSRGERRLAVCTAWVDDPEERHRDVVDEPERPRLLLSRSSDVITKTIALVPARPTRHQVPRGLPVEISGDGTARDSPGRRQGRPPLYPQHSRWARRLQFAVASSLPSTNPWSRPVTPSSFRIPVARSATAKTSASGDR